MIRSVVLCASETRTLRTEDIRRLEAFEMWIWRRIDRVSWMGLKTNEKILQNNGGWKKFTYWNNPKPTEKLPWLDHIMRGDALLRSIQSKDEWKREEETRRTKNHAIKRRWMAITASWRWEPNIVAN